MLMENTDTLSARTTQCINTYGKTRQKGNEPPSAAADPCSQDE